MKRRHLTGAGLCCLLAMLPPATLWAENGQRPGTPDRRRPPREAFDACSNKSEGDTVTITTPRGETVTATCRGFNGQLAAVPQGTPPPPPQGERDAGGIQ